MTADEGLRGVGVAVTRPGASPGRLGALLREAGAEIVHWPCIRFAPPADTEALEAAARRLQEFDWLIITSPRAARHWLAAAGVRGEAESGRRGGTLPLRTAAVGPATAAVLREAGWPVERLARTHRARGLIDAFEDAGDAVDARILFPCSDLAGDVLPAGLERLGASVERVVAYRTVPTPPDPVEVREAARTGAVRVVTFASPSAADAFLARANPETRADITRRLTAAAIGPSTADALADDGWTRAVATTATLEALAEAAGRAARRSAPPTPAAETSKRESS